MAKSEVGQGGGVAKREVLAFGHKDIEVILIGDVSISNESLANVDDGVD